MSENTSSNPAAASVPEAATTGRTDEAFVAEFTRALLDAPWWWQAAGRTEEEWHRDQRRRAIAHKCPALIHDQPIYCEMHVGDVQADGLARCAEPWIAHVLRPTGDPDKPWQDTGQRERVTVDA